MLLLGVGLVAFGVTEDPAHYGTIRRHATTFVEAMARGDAEAAQAHFSEKLRADFPPAVATEKWEPVMRALGPYERHESAEVVQGDEGGRSYDIVAVRSRHVRGHLEVKVTFERKSPHHIVGFAFVAKPLGQPAPTTTTATP